MSILSLVIVLLILECNAQVSVYQCAIDPVVSQAKMDAQQPIRVYNWHKTMSNYIKEELGHTQHLVCANYTFHEAMPQNGDSTYYLSNIDVVAWNNYSDLIKKYNGYDPDRVKPIHQRYNKPILWSETGPLSPNFCDNGTSYRKEAWMTAFTGIAGFNFWSGVEPIYHNQWDYLGNVRSFIEGNPKVAEMMLGVWEQQYVNSEGLFQNDPDPTWHWNEADRKEANYIIGTYTNNLGVPLNISIGVVSNLTDNYYTNTDLSDASWCATNPPQSSLILSENLSANTNPLFFSGNNGSSGLWDFTTDWYDTYANYLSTTNNTGVVSLLLHPLSCATDNCVTGTETPEIPFVLEWEFSDANFSQQIGIQEGGQFQKTDSNNSAAIKRAPTGSNTGLIVHPNPAYDHIFINCSGSHVIEFSLIDARGNCIRIIKKLEGQQGVDVSNLSSGVYVILAKDSNLTIKNHKRWVKY